MLKKAKEKVKEKVSEEIHKYVDGKLLPATYQVYVNESIALVDSVHLSYEEWCAKVLEEMKGEEE